MTRPSDDTQLDQVKAVLRRLQRISPDSNVAQPNAPGSTPGTSAPNTGTPNAGAPSTRRQAPVPPPLPPGFDGPPAMALSQLQQRPQALEARAIDEPRALEIRPLRAGGLEPTPLQPGEATAKPSGQGLWLMVAGVLAIGLAGAGAIFLTGKPAVDFTALTTRQPTPSTGGTGPVAKPTASPTTRLPAETPVRERNLDLKTAASIDALVQEASAQLSAGRVKSARAMLFAPAQNGSAEAAWTLGRSYDPNVLGLLTAPDDAPDVQNAEKWYRTWHALALQQGLVTDNAAIERLLRTLR